MNTTACHRSENRWQARPTRGEDRGMANFLETDRLVLRAFTAADIDHLLALDNDPEVMRFINGGRPTSRESIETRTLPGSCTTAHAGRPAATGPRRRSPPAPSWAGSSSGRWRSTAPPWSNSVTG